jgi:hypothetical protein
VRQIGEDLAGPERLTPQSMKRLDLMVILHAALDETFL